MSMTSCRVLRVAFVVVVAGLSFSARADEKSAPLLEIAKQKLRARDKANALKFLDAAVKADPDDAEAQILYQDLLRHEKPEKVLLTQYGGYATAKPDDPLLAFLATRLLKPEEAVLKFAGQVTKFPASPWPHEGRAAAFDALGKNKEAAAEHDAAVAASPREPRFRVSQAKSFERTGQWAQAAEIWKLAVGLRPTDRALILGLGEALRRGGMLDEAVTQFEAAAKLDPTDPEPLYRIGLARSDANLYDDALKSFNAAIALDKDCIDAYCAAVRTSVTRARDLAQKAKRDVVEADFTLAIEYGTRAIQAEGMNPYAHLALGNAQEAAAEVASGHGADALREYEAALTFLPATNPDRIQALVGRAYALLLNQRWDDALAAADKALDQDDHCVTAYLTAGRALVAKSDPDNAIKKYYTPGLKIAPDDAALHHARGISLWDNLHTTDAKKDLEAAVQAEPKNGRYQLSLGELYYFLKMYKQAETALVAAADLRPRDDDTWRVLGRTLTSLKDYEHAAAAFEEVVLLVEGDGTKPAPAPGTPPAPGAPAPGAPGAPDPAAPPPPLSQPPASGPLPTPLNPAPPSPGAQPPAPNPPLPAPAPQPADPQPPAPAPQNPPPAPAPTPPSGDPPPAPGTNPPATPPADAPPKSDGSTPAPGTPAAPGTPPAPGAPAAPGTAPAPGKDAPAAAPEPKFATGEHLYLTILYADFLKDREKAKVHARKWIDQGGKNPNLDAWVQSLLADK